MIKAAGLSVWQIIQPIFIITLIAGILGVIAYNPISMHLKKISDETGEHLFALTGTTLLSAQHNIWIRQDGEDGEFIFFATSTNPDRTEFFDVSIIFLDNSSKFGERVIAAKAVLKENVWELSDTKVYFADAQATDFPILMIRTFLTQEDIRERIAEPESVSFWELPSIISLTEKAGLPAYRYSLQFHTILSLPLLLSSMILIAASVAMNYSKMIGPGRIFLVGILAGFILYMMTQFIKNLGSAGIIPPILAAWVTKFNRYYGWNLGFTVQRGRLMSSHNETIEKLLTNTNTCFNLAIKFYNKLRILIVIALFLGGSSILSVVYANQHENRQDQFNVEAFDREIDT